MLMSLSIKNCSFCNRKIEPGTGTMLIKNDGSIVYFCSDKCRKNMLKLKRDPRKLKWTERYVKGGIKVKGR
ncbi:MAG: 50S ribosomal protein L24e [Candidatus Nitrosocaldaceae archaeon]|nr:MAG: 50S ribosomal protein L24e [Candidatus Nitrosocaldaceae archaeon]